MMVFVLFIVFVDFLCYFGKKVEIELGIWFILELWFWDNDVIDKIFKDRYWDFIVI